MISGVDFLTLPVQDMDRAVHFYRHTLGLTLPETWGDTWIEFDIGDVTLALVKPDGVLMPAGPVTTGTIALSVPDVDAAAEALAAKGVTFGQKVMDSGVCKMAMFTDSEGNALMLHHRYAPEA
ncbi:MAG: VOC family protein [Candidatus Sericytochromatia bacterium]|nr:VOC family protein [Candidatus Sericytochromatia bacterium]